MSALLELDQKSVIFLNTWITSSDSLVFLLRSIALYGVYLIPAIWLIRWFFVGKREREIMLSAILAGIISWQVINRLIKLLYFRPRPLEVLPIQELLFERPENAFPSDHIAFIAGMAFFYFFARGSRNNMAIGLLILAILVGISRVTMAVHYPGDIITAFATGLIGGWIVRLIHDYLCDTIWDRVLKLANRLRLA